MSDTNRIFPTPNDSAAGADTASESSSSLPNVGRVPSPGVPCEHSTEADAPRASVNFDLTTHTNAPESDRRDTEVETSAADPALPHSAAERGQEQSSPPLPPLPPLPPVKNSLITRHTESDWQTAQDNANLCERFLQLTRMEDHSLNTAAQLLGKSPSWFSGTNSMLARYQREGVAGLLPKRAPAKPADLTAQIEALGWFIPAAKYFYLLTNRTRDGGSVPEAIRKTISLPHVPIGWKTSDINKFLKALSPSTINSQPSTIPSCPPELREEILQRERAGMEFVPERVARQITVRRAVVHQYRNPTNAALDYLCSPGGMRLFEGRLARAGEIFEADDATVNFPVCVSWANDGSDDPCVRKFGVKVARFQWLVSIDVGTSFITGFNYTARPRSSYRAEDVLSLMRVVVRQHGVPRQWRLERGVWESNLVTNAIKGMGSELHTVYSPHQKPFIEGLFNTLWTKLSVHFPGAHVGRFRGEHESANDLFTQCQRGHKDPTKHFPMLASAIAAFQEVIAEKNRTPVESENHGRWIPEERWAGEWNPRVLDGASEWMFCPWVREWKVRGMLIGGRVPLFEDISVPFEFTAPWLVNYHGATVRCHFDPADPRCHATLVLPHAWNGHKAGVIGQASQISDAAAYVRLVMGWGEDPANAGRLARQKTAAAMRRETRAIVPQGQRGATTSEERDGLGTSAKIETGAGACTPSDPSVGPVPSPGAVGRVPLPGVPARTAEEIEQTTRQNEEFFQSNPLDFV
jgi:hypothetical protein